MSCDTLMSEEQTLSHKGLLKLKKAGDLEVINNSDQSEQFVLHKDEGSDIEGQTELEPPNGGYAWIIALAAMFASFATWGANAAFGIFLDLYISNDEFPGASQIDYAYIGGTVMFLAQVCAPISTFLCRLIGVQWVIAIGIVFQTLGYVLASISTKFWQIYLTQGVLIGISFSLIYIPSTVVLPTWFTTRKATSMDIAISGAGLGGLVFSLASNGMIQLTGDQRWALRMICCVSFVLVLISLIVLKPFNEKRKPLKETTTKEFMIASLRRSCDLTIFYKKYELGILASWFSFCQLGYVLLLFTVAPYASSIGLTSSQASNVNSVMNAASCVGRPLMGMVADKVGRFNAAAGISLMVSVTLYAFWINALDYGTMVGFSCVVGLISGVGATMTLSLASDLLDDKDSLDVVWGGICVVNSPFCLFAGVISLALTNDALSRPYLHSQVFAGTSFAYCFLSMLALREFIVRKTFKAELAELERLQLHGDEDLQMHQRRLSNNLKMTIKNYFVRMCYPVKL